MPPASVSVVPASQNSTAVENKHEQGGADRLPAPLTLRQTRRLLENLGHSPRKPLGQNFLVDANIVAKSLALANVTAGDVIVEVGPGLGTLTGALLAAGAEVYAVERDPTLARHLRSTLAQRFPKTFHLLEADAVDEPLAGLLRDRQTLPASELPAFKIVANLPYAISTPWLDAVLRSPVLPAEMVVMLQREAAERFAARSPERAGAKPAHIGAISVALDAAFEVAPGHRVPPTCFFPPPKVESYLLHLRRREQPRRLTDAARRLIRALFLHRRKQIGGVIKKLNSPDIPAGVLDTWLARLPAYNLTPQARPENVPFALWLELDDRLK